MAENYYVEAADGLQAAAKALRACGQEEASEDESKEATPRDKQPTDLKNAASETRRRFSRDRASA